MQAAFYEQSGTATQVLRRREVADPQPGPHEVRVRLRWSGVNPSERSLRAPAAVKQGAVTGKRVVQIP